MTSICGLDPRQIRGIISGTGLFLIFTMSSSLNYLASSGMAHTLISFVSPCSTSILSMETVKIFFLYGESTSGGA